MNTTQEKPIREINQYVRIPADDVFLLADLHVPEESESLVILANDGRCRNNPRSRHSARIFREKGIGTLICDLLTDDEAGDDETASEENHDAALLAKRLIAVTRWLSSNPDTEDLRIGYFGACAGGAAAMIAAAKLRDMIGAVVLRGGRLDLAKNSLPLVTCPTLLIVGENDTDCMELSRHAMAHLTCEKELRVISGASHLFGEPGILESMTRMSADWLRQHLRTPVHSG
jgi:dienelactone hydrolase